MGDEAGTDLRPLFPEFRPGEPWKGYPNIDPETDPYVTPGSVVNSLSVNTVRGVDHLRDGSSGAWGGGGPAPGAPGAAVRGRVGWRPGAPRSRAFRDEDSSPRDMRARMWA